MPTPRPLRVLHCPTTVGAHGPVAARVERALGLDSWAVAFRQNGYQFPIDEVLWTEGQGPLQRRWRLGQLLGRALNDFDIIHFNFGQTFFPQAIPAAGKRSWLGSVKHWLLGLVELLDLKLLRRAGKGIVITFQGDDARQGDFLRDQLGVNWEEELETGYYTAAWDAHKRWRIAQIARYADHLYAVNPDLLHVLPQRAQFIPYLHVDPRDWRPPEPPPRNPKPIVLHAPTHRGIKGTRHVLDAVRRLQDEGVPFEFMLVENLPWDQARSLFARADLLLDQLLIGWYGGLAVELMALGKPVMCYLRDGDLGFLPPGMRADLPLIQATPTTVTEVLRTWLTTRRLELAEVGRASRRFVELWHDPWHWVPRLIADYQKTPGARRRAAA